MSEELPVADTPLAEWLNERMGEWVDPQTGRRGLSVNKLARLSEVSQTSVFVILKEGRIPRADTLVKLAEFFNVSPMTLFRLVYIEDSGSGIEFSLEARAKVIELEQILSEVPVSMQVQFMESLISQAQMLLTVVERWRQVEEGEAVHE